MIQDTQVVNKLREVIRIAKEMMVDELRRRMDGMYPQRISHWYIGYGTGSLIEMPNWTDEFVLATDISQLGRELAKEALDDVRRHPYVCPAVHKRGNRIIESELEIMSGIDAIIVSEEYQGPKVLQMGDELAFTDYDGKQVTVTVVVATKRRDEDDEYDYWYLTL